MPTTVTKTVKSSGGDYTSLSGWEAGQQGDLVTADEIRQAECYAMEDTSAVVISGWTTDATRYWRIYTPAAERHDGKWNTGKYRHNPTNSVYNLDISDSTVTGYIEGLQFRNNYTVANTPRCILGRHSSGTVYVSACVLVMASSGSVTSSQIIGWDYGGNYKIWNNVFINDGGTGCTGYSIAGTSYVYSNTFRDCALAMQRAGGTIVAKNNLIDQCTTAASGTFAAGTDYNATNNASMGYTVTGGGNTHDRTSQTFTFVDAANDDFHLASGDTAAKDFGTDLSADANLAFSDDVDGVTRSGTWDIGADETAAGGGRTTKNTRAFPLGTEIGMNWRIPH